MKKEERKDKKWEKSKFDFMIEKYLKEAKQRQGKKKNKRVRKK